ncbi:MAG: hypothetical protein CL420_06425 [Acidimicrobiaceae bacterium]|jgi:hypothetical protein|nr:hypothetical protein [Acidimicrobiaceae bacterium]|tara:strand:- start:4049 stop:4459 length:411 start_codon:yes stop_codon:yes gene_type:complete
MSRHSTSQNLTRKGLVPVQRSGDVDYRLARERLLDAWAEGQLATDLICDAQPMLLRNAEHCGEKTEISCPICNEAQLLNVTYVFGPRLPAHGRCISVSVELDRINKRSGEFTAYLIEVCISCGWNHMIRSTTLGKY